MVNIEIQRTVMPKMGNWQLMKIGEVQKNCKSLFRWSFPFGKSTESITGAIRLWINFHGIQQTFSAISTCSSSCLTHLSLLSICYHHLNVSTCQSFQCFLEWGRDQGTCQTSSLLPIGKWGCRGFQLPNIPVCSCCDHTISWEGSSQGNQTCQIKMAKCKCSLSN